MPPRFIIFCLFLIFINFCNAQTIQVNPDGTHTVIFNHGSTSTQVNPDGTHSVIFNHGITSTQVNPDGTHTVIFQNGNTSTQVNPDGTHTTIFHNGITSTQVNPDGTHTSIFQYGNTSTHWNQDQKKTVTKTDNSDSENSSLFYSHIENTNEDNIPQPVDDTTIINQRVQSKEEFDKIKWLLDQEAIDSSDYAKLLLRIFNNIYDYEGSTADQIINLKNSFDSDSIKSEEYIIQKDQIIYGK